MSFDASRLMQLLPAVYAARDRGALASLLAVLAEQIEVLEEDLEQLYDDQFIETCAEWVVPYIGDLLGYRGLHSVSESVGRARAEVAHTIGLRRRKGTLAALEQLSFDVTGWHASAAEFFQRLITTQYMNHVRPQIHAAPDLRLWEPLERLGTAFDTIPRTIDVRRIESRRGRYNIPNLGLFVWRLQAFPLTRSPAARVDTRRYRFHPLGVDQPLFTAPLAENELTDLAGPLNVPIPISRRVLSERLADYYPDDDRVLSLRVNLDRRDGAGVKAVPSAQICVCHLGDTGVTWAHLPSAGKVAIDPVLGRIALPPEATDDWRVLVEFHYGFPADLGGGEYERSGSLESPEPGVTVVRVPEDQPTIQKALDALSGKGIVEITDSGRYEETLAFNVAPAAGIEVRAANQVRPTLVLTGECVLRGGEGSEVRLNGLLIAGNRLHVPAVDPVARLTLEHCTLVPGWTLAPDLRPRSPDEPSIIIESIQLALSLERCITGALRAPAGATIAATDCVIDSTRADGMAISALDESPGAALSLEGCTVIGRIRANTLPLISNSILLARSVTTGEVPVFAQFRQEGCVRFTWLPANSRTPQRYRCLPESADSPVDALPRFTSLRYGSTGYAQLTVASGASLLTGADNEAEPGAYHYLVGTWRRSNLQVRLDEYLRVGMQAGIIFES